VEISLTADASAAAWWRFGWDLVQTVLTAAVAAYVWWSQREQVRRDALTALEADVDDRLDHLATALAQIEVKLENQPTWSHCSDEHQRIATLEQAVRHAIKGEDINRVHARIDQIDTGLAELRGEMKANTHLLQTIDHHLRGLGPHL
jgi:Co/Zn/Cd efflux system component